MPVSERLSILIKNLKLTVNSFSKEIGISQSSIRSIVDNVNQPSAKVLIPIVERYPNVNLNWLLLGQGEMFLDEVQTNADQVNDEGEKYLLAKDKEIEYLKKENETLRNTLADKEEIIRLLKSNRI